MDFFSGLVGMLRFDILSRHSLLEISYISPMRPSISRSSKSISSKVNRSADNRTAPYISILYKWLFRLDRVKITIFTLDPSFVPRPSIPAENQGELLQLIPESVV
jgi:hypothetical protein